MTLIKCALNNATNLLKTKDIETPRLDAEILLAHVLKTQRELLFIKTKKILSKGNIQAYNHLIASRMTRKPIARILGYKEFWSLDFKLGPETLVPRPDSETLVETTLAFIKTQGFEKGILLDLGVGTGCLLLSLLSELPQWQGVGVDKSSNSIEVSLENARNLNLDERTNFVEGGWEDGELSQKLGMYDVIISNPPYIRQEDMKLLMPEVVNFEPKLALEGGPDGLDHYKTIIPLSWKLLTTKGVLFLELGVGQAEGVKNIMSKNGFKNIKDKKDLGGKVRVVFGEKGSQK
ncbi:MAG: peptide chain release factor N(5)-glutamine methyltransferase [Sphingomonadales bacterium]